MCARFARGFHPAGPVSSNVWRRRRPRFHPRARVFWASSRPNKVKRGNSAGGLDVINGLENTPKALTGLLASETRSKRIVKGGYLSAGGGAARDHTRTPRSR